MALSSLVTVSSGWCSGFPGFSYVVYRNPAAPRSFHAQTAQEMSRSRRRGDNVGSSRPPKQTPDKMPQRNPAVRAWVPTRYFLSSYRNQWQRLLATTRLLLISSWQLRFVARQWGNHAQPSKCRKSDSTPPRRAECSSGETTKLTKATCQLACLCPFHPIVLNTRNTQETGIHRASTRIMPTIPV